MEFRFLLLVIALPACSIDQRSLLPVSPADAGVSTSSSSTSDAGGVDTPESDAASPNADAGSTACVAGTPGCSPCAGCTINGDCVAAGTPLPGNACLICDPARNSVGYSPNTAAACGDGPSECSAQDTCSPLGQCVPNDSADGTHCGASGAGSFCVAGQCTTCGAADAPDALCLADSAATPLCDRDRGVCAACLPSSCTGATPHCDPAVGCSPCTEHSDCPGSACHLSGPSQGRCFDVGQVVQIPDADT
ncbi:MAG TPA: hypothetical protein VG963_27275, partial [Polyangiaceae bacterium]|nr:hypothetical protein [Polyangiaceae bacterium]